MDVSMPNLKRPGPPKRKRDFNRGYATLPPELLAPDVFPRLDARHMVILTFLASFGLDAWPSIDSLTKATGFSRSKVRRALYELTYIGVLTTRHRSDGRGRQTSNLYQLGDGRTDGGFSDSGRVKHIKACLAHDKFWTTLNQLFGSGKKDDADPGLVERFRWCEQTQAGNGLGTTPDATAVPIEGITDEAPTSEVPEPATESTQERPGVFVSEFELDPEYAKTTPFGEMKTRVDRNIDIHGAFNRLSEADPEKIEQMLTFCRERKMKHASDEIIVRAHESGYTLFDLEREYEYAVAKTTGKPQALFLTRLRKGYRVNDKKDGFDPKDPTHAYAKTELETWLDQAGLEKQYKQARVNQLTLWMIAILSVGHEPQDWLDKFCDEFRVSAEHAPPGVICAKLRDHFDDFARNQRVKTEAGEVVDLEAYLPNTKLDSQDVRSDDIVDPNELDRSTAGPEYGVLQDVSSVPLTAPGPSNGPKAAGVATLREYQAKYLAEVGKTKAELDAEAERKSVA
jgi:hypothetical protein